MSFRISTHAVLCASYGSGNKSTEQYGACDKLTQGESRGKVNVLGGYSRGHYKKINMNMCQIPNGYRDIAV